MTFGHVTAECVWYVRGAFSRCRMGLVYAAILKVGDYTQDERQSSRRNKPPELALHPLEERLVALRIPFMQIRELPRGRQLSMRGSVVNVPMDLEPTIISLPRNLDDSATVAVALKKKLCYSSVQYQENVRPNAVMKALHWLFINSELWKNADIEINANWFSQNGSTDHQGTDAFQETEDSHDTTDACNSADGDHEDIDTLRHQTHCSCPGIPDDHDSCHHNDHDSSNDESDHFSEVDDLQLSGNLESLLDGDISSEHLLTFAPGEGQQPLGLFQDKDSEYLAFPTIYCGQRHLDNKDRVTKVHYSDINTIVHITSVLYPSQRSTHATISHQLQPS